MRCASLKPLRTEIFAVDLPASSALASDKCFDVCRVRFAWRYWYRVYMREIGRGIRVSYRDCGFCLLIEISHSKLKATDKFKNLDHCGSPVNSMSIARLYERVFTCDRNTHNHHTYLYLFLRKPELPQVRTREVPSRSLVVEKSGAPSANLGARVGGQGGDARCPGTDAAALHAHRLVRAKERSKREPVEGVRDGCRAK